MKRVLVVCTGNSCRSQMAESIFRSVRPHLEVVSAGVKPADLVSVKSILVLREKQFPIDGLYPKNVSDVNNQQFDVVVTLGDTAQKLCPDFPDTTITLHVPFDDPFEANGSPNEILNEYRRIRDEIEEWIRSLDW